MGKADNGHGQMVLGTNLIQVAFNLQGLLLTHNVEPAQSLEGCGGKC